MSSEIEKNMHEFSYRDGKHRLKSIRWMLLFIAVMQTVIIAVTAFISDVISFDIPYYLQVFVIELFAYLLPISVYSRQNRVLTAHDVRERFGLKGCKITQFLLAALIGYGAQFAMILLGLPISMGISESGYIPQNPIELLAAVLVLAIMPAVFEEFLLRGIVYGVMAEFNTKAALIYTTIMFTLLHENLAGIPGYLLLGAVLVFVLRRTGSLYACMALHFMNNITALLLAYFSFALMDIPSATIKLFATGIPIGAAAVLVLALSTRKSAKTRKMKTSELLGQSFVNPPILLCIAIIIMLLYLQIY